MMDLNSACRHVCRSVLTGHCHWEWWPLVVAHVDRPTIYKHEICAMPDQPQPRAVDHAWSVTCMLLSGVMSTWRCWDLPPQQLRVRPARSAGSGMYNLWSAAAVLSASTCLPGVQCAGVEQEGSMWVPHYWRCSVCAHLEHRSVLFAPLLHRLRQPHAHELRQIANKPQRLGACTPMSGSVVQSAAHKHVHTQPERKLLRRCLVGLHDEVAHLGCACTAISSGDAGHRRTAPASANKDATWSCWRSPACLRGGVCSCTHVMRQAAIIVCSRGRVKQQKQQPTAAQQ